MMHDLRTSVLLLLHCLIYCGLWTYGRTLSSTGVLSRSDTPPDPPQPRLAPRRGYLIRVGQNLNLTCPYDVPFYSWTPSDEPAKILSDNQIFRIQAATLDDSGRYSCHAVDGYGRNTAEVAVRVIDPSSYVAQRECVLEPSGLITPDGPCFLISYSDRDLNPKMAWGESIILDCDVVTGSGNVDGLVYQWEVQYSRSISPSASSSNEVGSQRLLARSSAMSIAAANNAAASGQSLPVPAGSSSQSALSPTGADLVRFSEPKLRIDKLNLRHNGEYRCTVIDSRRSIAGLGSSGRSDVISRTFRLSVKPRAEGPIIQGPRTSNETVVAGHDAVFKCEVNPEEHRSSTIRWGKSIDANQRTAYEAEGREVIQWAGGTFVVLPSVPNNAIPEDELSNMASKSGTLDELRSMTNAIDSPGTVRRKVSRTANGVIPITGAVATEASPSQASRLVLRKVKSSDAGRYVCSVLTETGRDDHKFVHISVIGAAVGEVDGSMGNGVRRLTIYIAVPTAVFLVCLCVVTYCLVSRRASQSNRVGRRRQRNFYGQTQQSHLKSPSAASSSSIGMCRNGMSAASGAWNGSGDPRLRPSPAGTGPGTGTLCYSSTNGSNSMTGAGQVLIPTQGYQNAGPGSVAMLPGSYPLLIQPMSSQQAASYYTMQDANGLGSTYGPGVYPVSSASGNEYMLTNNSMNVVYPPGMIYPITNGHVPGQNSVLNSSSPDSSAITGPTDAVEGRLLYQPQGQGSSPVFPNFQAGAATTCGVSMAMAAPVCTGPVTGGAVYHHHHHHHQAPPSHLNSSSGDIDLGHGNTPLLSYHSHTDNMNTHNSLRS